MSRYGKNGVTDNTPKNIMFGAGTIHRDLSFTAYTYALTEDESIVSGKTYYTRSGSEGSYTYSVVTNPQASALSTYYERSGGWNFANSIIGATSGGSKIAIIPEVTKIEVDGALVPVKGLSTKTSETATMDINFIELTKEIIKAATFGQEGTSDDANFDLIESKADIAEGDYFENIAFVGKTLDNRDIIVIMEGALCTSGLSLEGKNKEGAIGAYTFECHAELDSDLDRLPWHIYYPKTVA